MLLGYGLLVLVRVLPHDAPVAGAISLVLGALLLARGLPRMRAPRQRLVAALGAFAGGGVLAYNVLAASDLSMPEWAILAYGVALLGAAWRLGRPDAERWAAAVGWSFPLVLAPLVVFAANASLSSPGSGAAAAPVVHVLLVTPAAWALQIAGTQVDVVGNNLVLATPRGGLTLGVGLVCAGIYPIVLFLGLVGVYAWQHRTPPRGVAALALAGVAGAWLLNLVRMAVLAKVGQAWGAQALQSAHANLGWVLFAAYMAAFWLVAFRFLEPRAAIGASSTRRG